MYWLVSCTVPFLVLARFVCMCTVQLALVGWMSARFLGMVPNLAEGGIDKTPKNARIPDNISLILSLYDSLP